MSIEEKKNGDTPSNLTNALSEAQSIIEAAELRAQEILTKAEQSYQEAKKTGLESGFEEGLSRASRQAVRMLESTGSLQESLAREAAKLAIAIAAKVLDEQLSIKPELVEKIALNALQGSVIGDAVTIILHPEDQPIIKKRTKDLKRLADGASIGLETDETINRGGCIVRTEFGEVDARIETLLESVREHLGLKLEDSKSPQRGKTK